MKHATTITIWSDIANGRCDELLRVVIDCETPAEATKAAQELLKATRHGYSGHFDMPTHPNQNTRNGFIR